MNFLGAFLLRSKQQAFLASVLGGLLFVLIFEMAYDGIHDHLYKVRDDAVITMSHARNLVDYGFIGINPSGGRVEGYSAPVQFFLYAAAYAVTGVGYAAWSGVQTVAATFLLGALLVLFFGERKLLAVALTGVAALFLTLLRPFLLWHGSGMENAITHVLILATVLILFFLVRTGRMHYWLAVPVFLASVSRVDGVFHVGPLLIVFGGVWLAVFRDYRGVRFSLLASGLWVLFHWYRYLYFGDLLPNTAYAQDVPLADKLRLWLALDWQHMREAVVSAGAILDFHGAKALLGAVPVLLMLSRRRETVLLALLLGSLILTAAFSESVFGHARMDRARTTTHLAVVSALGISALFYHLMLRRRLQWAVPFVAVAGLSVFGMGMVVPPYAAGWGVSSFNNIRKEFARIASAEDLQRPTVANPDLGVMSYHKQFNVIDMGRLGSPLIARLASWTRADYFFHYAAPDMVELHSFWSCHYDSEILSDPRFDELYRPVDVRVTNRTRRNCRANPKPLSGFWIRADILKSSKSAERRLIDRMKNDLSVDYLREELERCQNLSTRLHDCIYVARTAWRSLPEFRSRGQIGQLEEVFADSRTAPFDLYLITGYRDGRAHRDAARFVVEGWNARAVERAPDVDAGWIARVVERASVIRSDFDVYHDGNRLLYTGGECGDEEVAPPFFLHVFPEDEGDLPVAHREHGYHNLDFRFEARMLPLDLYFKDTPAPGGVKCIAVVDLPGYEVARIRTGQYFPGWPELWEGWILLDVDAGWIARVVERASVIRSDFDVYHDGNRLLYTGGECGDEEVAPPFFLHVFPEDEGDLPVARRERGYDNLDFRFEARMLPLDLYFSDTPAPGGVKCIAVVDLPGYEVARIRTGQFVPGESSLWHGEFEVGRKTP